MTRMKLEMRRSLRSAARLFTAGLVIAGTGSAIGCLDRPIAPNEPRTTTVVVERLTQSAVDKIDILLAIDNSGSMADKQEILATAIPDLVAALVNPPCLPRNGQGEPIQLSPGQTCPDTHAREFEPIRDIHIGVISSSLGGHGASSCSGRGRPAEVDMAHLITREREDPNNPGLIETYLNKGFLAWDPDQKLPDGPGEADINDAAEQSNPNADSNSTSLIGQLEKMVRGTGQNGCGYEAQLESVYRFLVDPEPYLNLTLDDKLRIVTSDIDTTVIEQRKAFLRPDSLLAIIMLSDENDCSIREESTYWLAAETEQRMWKPHPSCATDLNHECCMSCKQLSNKDEKCAAPECWGPDGQAAFLDSKDDPINLRCWEQKRRFGFDFLYPIDRYRDAFTQTMIVNRRGELVPNPIFSDLNDQDALTTIRSQGLVFFAGIVGVPWQDIARQDGNGVPRIEAGFKNAEELNMPVRGDLTTWDIILGDWRNHGKPADPLMVESDVPRTGNNPITGDALVAPDATGWNPINGREYTTTVSANGDLQYACIFELPTARPCTGDTNCDCNAGASIDNPLCAPGENRQPGDPGPRSNTQVMAKAYPGLRELALIQSLGPQGIVGSVCPAELRDKNSPTYGYRPAIGAIVDTLKTALGGQCLPRELKPDAQGQVTCLILEARNTGGNCDCNTTARQPVTDIHQLAKDTVLRDPIAKPAGWDCVCEVKQLLGDELLACQNDDSEEVRTGAGPVHGWCYVDEALGVGNPSIVANCPATEKRIIRFVGEGEAQVGATQFIMCSSE